MFDFFLSFDFRTCWNHEGSSAPEILLSTVEFLGTSSFFELFIFEKTVICSKKPATFYECVTHPLVDFLQMGLCGCVTPRLCSQRFFAGSLGPQTVVGSASFNLFCDPRHGV